MQTPERFEYRLAILLVNPDSVVPDRENPPFVLFRGCYVYLRGPLAPVLDRVADQILEQLSQLCPAEKDRGQRIICNGGSAFFNRLAQVGERVPQGVFAIYTLQNPLLAACQRVSEQILDQMAHPARSIDSQLEQYVLLWRQIALKLKRQQLESRR